MDLSDHTLSTMFAQLGLLNTDEQIDEFILQHKIDRNCQLVTAEFWTPAQAAFLTEALQDDSDWVLQVEQLDARLRY